MLYVVCVLEFECAVVEDVFNDDAEDVGVWCIFWEMFSVFIYECACALYAFVCGYVGVE